MRTSAGARSTCPRSSSRRPPTGSPRMRCPAAGPQIPARRRGRGGGGRVTNATLERRLANYRAAIRPDPAPSVADKTRSAGLAEMLATAVDGEVVDGAFGAVVRCEPLTVVLPLDRERLACLPGQPPPDVPLVCLDTETTGLATASGTVAFLIGLGWWEDDRFRQVQLLLPDHPAEPGLLGRVA